MVGTRSGSQYLQGLRDRRAVYFRGQRIHDVSSHQTFRRCACTVAGLFDAIADVCAVDSEVPAGSVASIRPSFVMPRTVSDFLIRKQWSEAVAKKTYGLMGRSPDFLQTALMSFASAAPFFAVEGKEFQRNIEQTYERCAKGDLFLARATVGPATNRGKSYSDLDDQYVNVGVLKETDSGVILRGAKMLSTNAAIADELLVFPLGGFSPGEENYALAFTIPIATNGLKLICREAFDDGSRSPIDFPLSTRFEESDALCVFDDVLVPWERVFLYRDIEKANQMYAETNSRNFTGFQTLIRINAKSDFLISLAIACAELNGCSKHLHVQQMLGEIVAYGDVMRGLLTLAESNASINKWGVLCPDSSPAQSARILFYTYSARMLEVIQTVAGGTLLGLPTKLDLEGENGELIRKAFQTEVSGWTAAKKIRLFKLAWEMVGDGFGQRQQIYEKYHAGDPFRIAASHFLRKSEGGLRETIEDALRIHE